MIDVTFTREKRERLVDAAVTTLEMALTADVYRATPTQERVELALKVLKDMHQFEMDLLHFGTPTPEDAEEDSPDGP